MPVFYLDDEPIEFEPGENLLPALLRSGKYVPHYCYHPGLRVTAQCRQCLVDVTDAGNGRPLPKLQASCATPAAENMRISSKNEKVVAAQNMVNEYLLVNHPLDCPICDQAGECELQNIAYGYGTGHSEIDFEKRVYGWRDVGTFIVLERNRCIHCSRCERFTRDITGTHDFGAFLRTHELTFDTFEDHRITDKFQGNLADICPVGAILNRDWRFKKRAWKLHKTQSVCPSCSTGCNITVEHHGNRIYRLKPRQNMEVNRWWMCDEGRVNFHHLNDRQTRFHEPHARIGGELRPVGWQAVYDALAARLKELGAAGEQVVGLSDTHASNEELALFTRLLAEGLGGAKGFYPHVDGRQQEEPPRVEIDPFIYTLITTDKSPNTAGAKAAGLTGDPDGSAARAALGKAKVAVILGAAFADNGGVTEAVRACDLIVQIGHYEGPWSGLADVVLPGRTYTEKAGSFVNKAGRVQRFEPAVRPPSASREEVRILGELLAALGTEVPHDSAATVFNALGAADGPFKGLSWAALGDLGQPLPGSAA